MLDQPVPQGLARWDGKLVAEALGDVDINYVRRFLRKQKIDLAGRKSWFESYDPDFAAKVAVVGLYMSPPENAIVIFIDEKPSIQALERAQGYLKIPHGRALTGRSHDYKRHGITTVFAAYEVATGRVLARHEKWRLRNEFLAFMDDVVAAYPSRRLDDADDDHGQRQFCQACRGFRQQAVEAELFRHTNDGGDRAVRQRAFDAQIVDGQRHGFVLQHAAQGFDLGVRPIGDIGDGARFDFAAIAIAFAQQRAARSGLACGRCTCA